MGSVGVTVRIEMVYLIQVMRSPLSCRGRQGISNALSTTTGNGGVIFRVGVIMGVNCGGGGGSGGCGGDGVKDGVPNPLSSTAGLASQRWACSSFPPTVCAGFRTPLRSVLATAC